jgi:hypothetical protein
MWLVKAVAGRSAADLKSPCFASPSLARAVQFPCRFFGKEAPLRRAPSAAGSLQQWTEVALASKQHAKEKLSAKEMLATMDEHELAQLREHYGKLCASPAQGSTSHAQGSVMLSIFLPCLFFVLPPVVPSVALRFALA